MSRENGREIEPLDAWEGSYGSRLRWTYPQFLWEKHVSCRRKPVGMRVASACTSIKQFRAALA